MGFCGTQLEHSINRRKYDVKQDETKRCSAGCSTLFSFTLFSLTPHPRFASGCERTRLPIQCTPDVEDQSLQTGQLNHAAGIISKIGRRLANPSLPVSVPFAESHQSHTKIEQRMKNHAKSWHATGLSLLLIVLSGLVFSPQVQAQQDKLISLDPPGERDFILDKADMISAEDEAKIKQIADQLLTDKAAPIVVVTIDSMSRYGGRGMRIETYARLLFDQWGIGYEKVGDVPWNYGMLFLISKQDRKARIELGAGWKHDKDAEAQRIMDEMIIPKFKDGDFSGGILAGVEGLDKIGRGLEIPQQPRPMWHYVAAVAFVGLAIFTVISLIRRGASGWAWLMWAAVFAGVGAILYHMATSSSSSGGGFSGGSFGGGFSGGGGASGSW